MHNIINILNVTKFYILKQMKCEFYAMYILPKLKKENPLPDYKDLDFVQPSGLSQSLPPPIK